MNEEPFEINPEDMKLFWLQICWDRKLHTLRNNSISTRTCLSGYFAMTVLKVVSNKNGLVFVLGCTAVCPLLNLFNSSFKSRC